MVYRLLELNPEPFFFIYNGPMGRTCATDPNIPCCWFRLDTSSLRMNALLPPILRNSRYFMDWVAAEQEKVCSGSTLTAMQQLSAHRRFVGSDTLRSDLRHPYAWSGALPWPERVEQHLPAGAPPSRDMQHPTISGSPREWTQLTVISACTPWSYTELPPRVRLDSCCAQQTPAEYEVLKNEDCDEIKQSVHIDVHGPEILLPRGSALGTAKWSSACPYTYVSKWIMDFQGPFSHIRPVSRYGNPSTVLLEDGTTRPYFYILEFVDIHFQDSGYALWSNDDPPEPDSIIHTHRLFDVPVVDLPVYDPNAPSTSSQPPPNHTPCHICLGNDLLDACSWSLNHLATMFNTKRYDYISQLPVGGLATGQVLQFSAPSRPGLLFMVPTTNVQQQTLPSTHPTLSPWHLELYLRRICATISYTCLPLRIHSFSVLSELDVFEYSASIMDEFWYPCPGPDGRRKVVSSALRPPLDASDVFYPQWTYHQHPWAHPLPAPPPPDHLAPRGHRVYTHVPLIHPAPTLRHVSSIRARQGQHLRNNERNHRSQVLLQDPAEVQLYSTAGIRVGWVEHSHPDGRVIGYTATRNIPYSPRHHMCHPAWRNRRFPEMVVPWLFPDAEGVWEVE
jgi:hypothetical protein